VKLGLIILCLTMALPATARESYEAEPSLIQPGGLILFFNDQGPLSYASLTRKPKDAIDVGEVTCTSCQNAVSIPLLTSLNGRNSSVAAALGNGGFDQALMSLKSEHPDLKGIYNVMVDVHRVSILGIFGRLCTEVTGRGFR